MNQPSGVHLIVGGYPPGNPAAHDMDGVRLRLGRVPIHLPEPVATLARTVLADRKGHATIGARQPSPWLFPGGQPGRPLTTARLTRRLNELGIRPSQDRSTALFQLAAEIPAGPARRGVVVAPSARRGPPPPPRPPPPPAPAPPPPPPPPPPAPAGPLMGHGDVQVRSGKCVV